MKTHLRRFISMMVSLLAVGLPLASNIAPAEAAGKFLVDDDKVQCPTANYTDIQSAVNAAGAGPAKITVCAGTYLGLVHIQNAKSITLSGKPGAKLQPNFGPYNQPLIEVDNSTKITVQGLTLDGQNSLSTGGPSALLYINSSGTIQKNTIVNWHAPTFPTSRAAKSIELSGPPSRAVKISMNNLPGIDLIGIFAVGEKVTASKNVISAASTATNAATGITVSTSAKSSVSGNTLSADAFPGGGTFTGIYVYNANMTRVSSNIIKGAQTAIWVTNDTAQGNKNRVTGNKISQASLGIYVNCYSASAVIHCDYVRVTANKILNSTTGNTGIIVFADGASPLLFGHVEHATVKSNTILHYSIGVEHNTGLYGVMNGSFAPNPYTP